MAPKKITMTREGFFTEHKKLIKLLSVGEKLAAEAKAQKREMLKYK